MTKKLKIFGLALMLGGLLLLNGCEFGGGEGSTNSNLPDNEVTSIMKSFAKQLKLKETDIKEESFYWYNYVDTENPENELSGYGVQKSGIKEKDLPNTTEFFDGRQVEYIGDEIGGSLIDYYKNNIVCSQGLFYDQEIPYELMAWERDENDEDNEEAYEQAWKDFNDKVTYNIELDCGFRSESTISAQDFYFDAEGMEPFWRMSIRGTEITRSDPEKIEDYYISRLTKDGDNIHFEGYDIEGDIVKEDCIDGGKGDTHEYKISVFREGDMGYMGCADKYNTDFLIGEEGTLQNFIKKTNYQYKGNTKRENVFYDIFGIVNNYVYATLHENNGGEYNPIQLIIEKTDNGWKVLYEGSYEVDYDKCEELFQYDNNLLEMFFLRNCPRG